MDNEGEKKQSLVDSWEASNLRTEARAEAHQALCLRDVECRELSAVEQKRTNAEHEKLLANFNSGTAERHRENVALSLEERKVQERIAAALEKIAEKI